MLFHVIESFRDGNSTPVYRRFRDHGRMLPEGVEYVASWVASDLARSFQVMEAESREALDAWMERWADLTEFAVVPVVASEEASGQVA